ncbi:hypothetical protein BsWGS_07077 [Bradybaena similaris]
MFIFALLLVLPALALAQTTQHLEAVLLAALDGNKDGHVTLLEAETYFLKYDTDNDGKITEQEFITNVDKVDPAVKGHEHSLYVLFDRDGNKVVDKKDIDAAFQLADLNKNNQIDKSELHLIVALASSSIVG